MKTASTLLIQRRRQAGFLLPTMAIVVVLIALIAGLLLQQYADERASAMGDERAELVGARLAAFDDAAKTYVTTFFTQIQRQQQAQRNGYAVPAARVQAPTTADLVGLGMLRSEDATEFVYNGRAIGFTLQLTVPSSGCTIPNCNVQSLVVSTQPMVELRDQSVVDVRRASIAAAAASPGRAGVSLPESPTAFVSKDGAHVALNTSGAAGLIGIKNGYDSSGFLEFARRDGSLPMTGDINMQDDSGARHGIRNASDVATQTVTASGRVKTGEFLDLDGPIQVEGTPCEKRGLAASDAGGLILSCQSGRW
ncbi:shufflon system plasmid conjugative transfer pilus tip adhesin PilV, partial [Comamonas sp. CMM01]|uniref:shufflon system plasmid conjugative transfer pilus tip adhesin PilV n=1 Tax=Comamonas sp. CMM01 TaxID=2769280 RepID=UPI00178746DB